MFKIINYKQFGIGLLATFSLGVVTTLGGVAIYNTYHVEPETKIASVMDTKNTIATIDKSSVNLERYDTVIQSGNAKVTVITNCDRVLDVLVETNKGTNVATEWTLLEGANYYKEAYLSLHDYDQAKKLSAALNHTFNWNQ